MKLKSVRFLSQQIYSPGPHTSLHATYRLEGGPGVRKEQIGGPTEQIMQSIELVSVAGLPCVRLVNMRGLVRYANATLIADFEELEPEPKKGQKP